MDVDVFYKHLDDKDDDDIDDVAEAYKDKPSSWSTDKCYEC